MKRPKELVTSQQIPWKIVTVKENISRIWTPWFWGSRWKDFSLEESCPMLPKKNHFLYPLSQEPSSLWHVRYFWGLIQNPLKQMENIQWSISQLAQLSLFSSGIAWLVQSLLHTQRKGEKEGTNKWQDNVIASSWEDFTCSYRYINFIQVENATAALFWYADGPWLSLSALRPPMKKRAPGPSSRSSSLAALSSIQEHWNIALWIRAMMSRMDDMHG